MVEDKWIVEKNIARYQIIMYVRSGTRPTFTARLSLYAGEYMSVIYME